MHTQHYQLYVSVHTHHMTSRMLVSLTLASPNTMKVSEAGLLYTSGLLITNRMFLDFLIVTLLIPGRKDCSTKALHSFMRTSSSPQTKIICYDIDERFAGETNFLLSPIVDTEERNTIWKTVMLQVMPYSTVK